jgi:hypothetical protein
MNNQLNICNHRFIPSHGPVTQLTNRCQRHNCNVNCHGTKYIKIVQQDMTVINEVGLVCGQLLCWEHIHSFSVCVICNNIKQHYIIRCSIYGVNR